jgi:hypothetical protein
MSTWLDHSTTGVLALCRDCPSWRELARDTADGWAKARAHAYAVHGADSPSGRHAGKNASRRATGRA